VAHFLTAINRRRSDQVEEAVRRHILDHAPDPEAVWFDGWGPNTRTDHQDGTVFVVRIKFRLRDRSQRIEHRDCRYTVRDGRVTGCFYGIEP
jgi:hypothetical protein